MTRTYGFSVVTPPSLTPVTPVETRRQCGIDEEETYWDDQLAILIGAATSFIQSSADLSIMNQTLRLTLPRFPCGRDPIYLPRGPVTGISSVLYTKPDGTDGELTAGQYQRATGAHVPYLVPAPGQNWPATQLDNPNAVAVTYYAGNATVAGVNRITKQLILLLVGHWFRNREAVVTGTIASEVPMAANALLDQLRVGSEFISYGT